MNNFHTVRFLSASARARAHTHTHTHTHRQIKGSADSPAKPVRPLTLLLLVLIRLVSSLASVSYGVLLHAVDFRFHLGTASSSKHEEDQVARDHGGDRSEEIHRDAVRRLWNSQTYCD